MNGVALCTQSGVFVLRASVLLVTRQNFEVSPLSIPLTTSTCYSPIKPARKMTSPQAYAATGDTSFNFPAEILRMVLQICICSETPEPMDDHDDASQPLGTRFHLVRRVTSESPEYALMLVCKSFNAFATKHFYKTISIHCKRQLIALSECLLQSPNLAHNVATYTRKFDFHQRFFHRLHPGQTSWCSHNNIHDRDMSWLKTLVHVVRSFPKLTHLIVDAVDFSGRHDIGGACTKLCPDLEVLHWGLSGGCFRSDFKRMKVLRLASRASVSPQTPTAGFPSLHTIEAGKSDFLVPFRADPLPSLSTVHIRNERFKDVHFITEGVNVFLPAHGEKIKTLTIIGVVGEQYGRHVVPFLLGYPNLEKLVMDVIDLVRLLRFDNLVLPQVNMMGLTNYAPTALPTGNNFQATLIANLRAHFPALVVLRWLGDVDRGTGMQGSSDPLDRDTHQINTAGIRIESRDGEKLELHWLLVR
ncbi:hypothetical protein BD410DRAFT_383464 [Rickenella mellea]|uniref:F-box domain-containing protein n=1 Tax=Rickenella mellea TaxID=50990 RepID=A0A4Y7PXN2_9AGAM|nr:hypothetical protein BD410DRAFT_383464 [Rickenella mellea]